MPLNYGMARECGRGYLTLAFMAPLTLIGVLYVIHLMRDDRGDPLWQTVWFEVAAGGVLWCIIWFILWIRGTFKRWEEEQPYEK